MALFVMMTTLTDEGRKTIKTNPERIRQVNKEVEAMGVKIVMQYALMGQYDFINILEAPDNQSVVRVSMELGARGTLIPMTMSALTLDEFIKALKK